MSATIKALGALRPTGPTGFEGLIAAVLQSLTGKRFRLAASGSQQGRDMRGDRSDGVIVAAECKRYREDTQLDQRELLGEMAQAVLADPDLDLWVLVTLRTMPTQLADALGKDAENRSISFEAVEGEDLLRLLAAASAVTVRWLEGSASPAQLTAVRNELEHIAGFVEQAPAVARLKAAFSAASIGYDQWRLHQNAALLGCFRDPGASRAAFGQPVTVASPTPALIRRDSTADALDLWLRSWREQRRPLALLGEEGDGKTWAAADWIARQISGATGSTPAVLFVNVRAIDGSPRLPDLLVRGAHARPSSDEVFARRVARWCGRGSDEMPAIILAVDGLNERHNINWRALFDGLAAAPWRDSIALIVTCRSQYWERHRPPGYLGFLEQVVPAFSEEELAAALDTRGHRGAQFAPEVLPLVRKPRYLDLVLRYHERLAGRGEITRQRLLYEDWKDRYERKTDIALDNEEFQQLLIRLAQTARHGRRPLSHDEAADAIPRYADRDASLVELATGGVFTERFDGTLDVHPERLTQGFGLLLGELVREAAGSAASARERIESWLEPEAGIDEKGEILDVAALHALSSDGFPLPGIVALLRAWATAQNAPSLEAAFPTYIDLRPDAYVALAEDAWEEHEHHPIVHRLVRRAFLLHRDSVSVQATLARAFERWLGFVHPGGLAALVGADHSEVQESRSRIERGVGHPLAPGPLRIGEFDLTVVESPRLLRLGRLALSVISAGPRTPFVRALVLAHVAEAVMRGLGRDDVVAWVSRSAPDAIADGALMAAELLLSFQIPLLERAAYNLLEDIGSNAALERKAQLPKPVVTFAFDPCKHSWPWKPEHAWQCLAETAYDPNLGSHGLSRAALQPGFEVPPRFAEALAAFSRSLLTDALWSHTSTTAEDAAIELREATLCAFAPQSLASIYRAAAAWFATRRGLPLQSLGWELQHHHLLFGNQEWSALADGWRATLGSAPDSEQHAEAQLFRLLLCGLGAHDQLGCLLERPATAPDYLSFEDLFRDPPDWTQVAALLAREESEHIIRRVLWVVLAAQSEPPPGVVEAMAAYRVHHAPLVRALALAAIRRYRPKAHVNAFLESDWSATRAEHFLEAHHGSWLWIECAAERPWRKVREHIGSVYLGDAVAARGFRPDDVDGYSTELATTLGPAPPAATLPTFALTRRTDRSEAPPRYGLELISDSVSFVSPAHSWGDSFNAGADALRKVFAFEERETEKETAMRAIRDFADEQVRAGNPWFAEGPPDDALTAVLRRRPELVRRWLAIASDQSSRVYVHWSFYEDLCIALLGVNPEAGITLLAILARTPGHGFTRHLPIGVNAVDLALWRVPPADAVAHARHSMAWSARTDADLFNVALAAGAGSRESWLTDRLRGELARAPSLLDQARIVSLLGLMADASSAELLETYLRDAPTSWVTVVATLAESRRDRDRRARHWFTRFVAAEADDDAWASFRLCLRCIDRRFWLWRSETIHNAGQLAAQRSRFLAFNESEIRRWTETNERDWQTTFLGARVLPDQAVPWLEP